MATFSETIQAGSCLAKRFGRAIKRGILGRSSHEYSRQFSGSDEYWNDVVLAQAAIHRDAVDLDVGSVRHVPETPPKTADASGASHPRGM